MLMIVTNRTASFQRLAVRFHEEGVFFFFATPKNATRLCKLKDTGGVILDCTQNLTACELLCRSLNKRYPDMPIAAILPPTSIPDFPVVRIIREQRDPESLVADMIDFARVNCGMDTEVLSTYSLFVGRDPDKTQYMGYPLPLSRREHLILRYLFYRSPKCASAQEIMEVCYTDGSQQCANAAIMISRINRRAAKIDPRPLIVNEYGKGYRLRNGILPDPNEKCSAFSNHK